MLYEVITKYMYYFFYHTLAYLWENTVNSLYISEIFNDLKAYIWTELIDSNKLKPVNLKVLSNIDYSKIEINSWSLFFLLVNMVVITSYSIHYTKLYDLIYS